MEEVGKVSVRHNINKYGSNTRTISKKYFQMCLTPLHVGCLINYSLQIQAKRVVGKNPSSPHGSHPLLPPCLKHLATLCSSGWFDLEFISNNWCAFWNLFKQFILWWVAQLKKNCSNGACQRGRTEMGNSWVLGVWGFRKLSVSLSLTQFGCERERCLPLQFPWSV